MGNQEQILQSLADLLTASELRSYAVKDLAPRFAKAGEEHRDDALIKTVGGVIENMAKHDRHASLTSQEIRNLFERFAGIYANSKFKEVFADLLPSLDNGMQEVKNTVDTLVDHVTRQDFNDFQRDLPEISGDTFEVDERDIAMENAVESLNIGKFNKTAKAIHNPALVHTGREAIIRQLEACGARDVRAKMQYATEEGIFYGVQFPTVRGTLNVIVPVPVREGQIGAPTMFLDAIGKNVYSLSNQGLTKHFYDLDDGREQSHLNSANSIRHNMTTDHRDVQANTLEVDEVEAYVDEVVPVRPSQIAPELADVEAILEDSVLTQESQYNNQAIQTGRDVVTRELRQLGHSHSVVRFAGDNPRGMSFDVTLRTGGGNIEITIPTEVVAGNILYPAHFVADDGKVRELSAEALRETSICEEHVEPIKYTAALIDMDYNSLRKVVHRAAFDKRHNIAKEALAAISDKFGKEAHNVCIRDYTTWMEQAADNFERRCTGCAYYRAKGSRHATSSHDYCNLLHTKCANVVKTKQGICVRAHLDWDRQNDDQYQGSMMTNQVKLT